MQALGQVSPEPVPVRTAHLVMLVMLLITSERQLYLHAWFVRLVLGPRLPHRHALRVISAPTILPPDRRQMLLV